MLSDDLEADWGVYDGSYSVAMSHGFDLFLLPGCEYSKKRFFYRVAEKNELDFLDSFDFNDYICLDIGANIGYWSAWLARKNVARVYSFEPDPHVFKVLEKNMGSFSSVVVENIAFSASCNGVELFLNSEHSGDNSILKANQRSKSILVKSSTINKYCENFSRLDFIKLDTQGSEKLILENGLEIISKFKPTILLEVDETVEKLSTEEHVDFIIKLTEILESKIYIVQDGYLNEIKKDDLLTFTGNIIISPPLGWFD